MGREAFQLGATGITVSKGLARLRLRFFLSGVDETADDIICGPTEFPHCEFTSAAQCLDLVIFGRSFRIDRIDDPDIVTGQLPLGGNKRAVSGEEATE